MAGQWRRKRKDITALSFIHYMRFKKFARFVLREESQPSDFSICIVVLPPELWFIVCSKGSWLSRLPRCSLLKIIMKNSESPSPEEI